MQKKTIRFWSINGILGNDCFTELASHGWTVRSFKSADAAIKG